VPKFNAWLTVCRNVCYILAVNLIIIKKISMKSGGRGMDKEKALEMAIGQIEKEFGKKILLF